MNRTEPTGQGGSKKGSWLKRLGWAGFLFFFIKGLIWLAVFAGVGTLWAC